MIYFSGGGGAGAVSLADPGRPRHRRTITAHLPRLLRTTTAVLQSPRTTGGADAPIKN